MENYEAILVTLLVALPFIIIFWAMAVIAIFEVIDSFKKWRRK